MAEAIHTYHGVCIFLAVLCSRAKGGRGSRHTLLYTPRRFVCSMDAHTHTHTHRTSNRARGVLRPQIALQRAKRSTQQHVRCIITHKLYSSLA